jgi:5-methylcytosine-specific restriction endonuclease McrBC GTP-binding regulatory subunit McrB
VATQTRAGLAETLALTEVSLSGYIVDDVLYVPPSLPIPPNLALSGTVNVDETTHAFSDKVLDRANSIEFNRVDLDRFAEQYRQRFPDRLGLIDETMPVLVQVYNLLEPRYLHFGYRTLEEVFGYLWQNEILPDDMRRQPGEVLDNQLMQKILPKLRGDERARETLSDLRDLLKVRLGEGSRSVGTLERMLDELDTFGSTEFWR